MMTIIVIKNHKNNCNHNTRPPLRPRPRRSSSAASSLSSLSLLSLQKDLKADEPYRPRPCRQLYTWQLPKIALARRRVSCYRVLHANGSAFPYFSNLDILLLLRDWNVCFFFCFFDLSNNVIHLTLLCLTIH